MAMPDDLMHEELPEEDYVEHDYINEINDSEFDPLDQPIYGSHDYNDSTKQNN